MIAQLKNKISDLLRRKEVSLAMIVDRDGRILWHEGRSIRGRQVSDGEGFSRSALEQALAAETATRQEDVVISSSGGELPHSARILYVRSLLVLPAGPGLFLYVDSGVKEKFSEADREVFVTLGELLRDSIAVLQNDENGEVCGASPAMKRVRELAVRYAMEEEPVLLGGETGVGKTRLAEWVHRLSGRRGRFVPVHLPALPENLLESELFGHRKGAFTGAGENRRGLVEEAEGGTLFLDEIADIPAVFQSKLLRFLDTRAYRPLGESCERRAAVRLMAATNRDLAEEVRARRFREDLWFRLNVLPLEIPPLRERREDIRVLVREHERCLRGKRPGAGFWETLLAHNWPGNVRELIHVLTRAGVQLEGAEVSGNQLEAIIRGASPISAAAGNGPLAAVETALATGAGFWEAVWPAFLDRELNRHDLHELLTRRFEAHDHSLKKTAESLGVSGREYARFVSALHKYRVHPGREP
jgi:DNA-binding NtrC family response regulator